MQTLKVKNENELNKPNEKKPVSKNWLRFVLELTLSLMATLLLLEVIFAWSGVGEQECLKVDDELGFSLFENRKVSWRREGFSRCTINNFGMQDREYSLSKPTGVQRIAIAGDSYVEALQVDRKDNFCSLLRDLLDRNSNVSHQVMNFGVQAHNLSQTFLNLEKSVFQFAPDIVIVPYRPDATYLLPPDIKSGFLGARPNFFVDQNGNLIKDKTVQNLWLDSASGKRMQNTSWLRRNSHIWGIMSTGVEVLSNWKAQGGLLKNFTGPIQHVPNPSFQSGKKFKFEERTDSGWTKTSKVGEKSIAATWPIANALITEMNNQCRKRDCRLVMVRLPGVNGHFSPLETQLLKDTCSANGIPLLDLTDSFHQNLKMGKKLFYQAHFAEDGHVIVADRLYEFLKSENLL